MYENVSCDQLIKSYNTKGTFVRNISRQRARTYGIHSKLSKTYS